ncbi:MAG: hypothetical protein D3910_14650, partial [Candidatus Electrothrix sp. ATG2]|nr:hypothetical protein [Candidatus Electrothrix sp. ATG2]
IEQEIFVGFFAEDFFEAVVGEKIDVAFFGCHRIVECSVFWYDVTLYPIVTKCQIRECGGAGKIGVLCDCVEVGEI